MSAASPSPASGAAGTPPPATTFTGAALVHPLRREVRSRAYPQGATVAEVAADLLPDRHGDLLLACALNSVPVPRELWSRVRPKPGTVCQFVPVPGDGNTALRIGLTLAVVAAAAAATVATGGALAAPGLGLSATAIGVGSAVVGATIATAGLLLVDAEVPPA